MQGIFEFPGVLPGESVVEEEPCFGSAHGMSDGKKIVPQLGFFDNDFRGRGHSIHFTGVTPFTRMTLPYFAVSPVMTTAKASRARS